MLCRAVALPANPLQWRRSPGARELMKPGARPEYKRKTYGIG